MELIDGMKFDDRFQGGFIREGVYWHPTHRFSFNVPSQFIAGHGVSMKLASSDGLLVMRVRNGDAPDFDKLVDSTKSADTPFKNPKRGEVNGIATVSVSISDEFQGDEYFGEVTFFDLDDQYVALSYFAKRKDTSAMRPVYDEVISSFKRTQFGDAPGRREFKARKVQGGESVKSIAGAARFDGDGESELRLWNGLGDGEAAAIGDWIKYVE
jgi:predicted Zn-dependent protease